MGKGEIAGYKQFLIFPQCFQKACFPGVSKGVIVWEWAKILELQTCKNQGLLGKGLKRKCRISQSFISVLTERVCRRQFQISRKCKKFIQTGRKHCGKWRNCSLRAISPFPTVFSKGLFPRGIKRCHFVGMV